MTKSIHTDDYQALVKVLRTLRKEAGLTQSELAVRLDRKQAFISAVEVEGRRLDLIQLRAWAVACESDLMTVVKHFEVELTR